ncbi:DUF4124 domain-containing protein [Photobacterium sp. SDRW27]|uniref:DUF4124 domain-containing protein n=1 Tax=Photobacterium obscurum TaxID=2829490 RepID=UPI00224387DC|nr:DUF4124 domain-containing protein [Photobacterium obscurum]MCW8331079.1 DUF4124 domain-containing protein [Photobacterium obscurum]
MKKAPSPLLFTITLAGLITATGLQATTIYTWEDENGVIHFSDQAKPGASTVELNTLPSIETRHPTAISSAEPDVMEADKAESALPPATIRLLSPLHQQTIRDNEGIISVSAVSNRKLDKGHTVQLLLDGKPYGRPQTQLNWRMVNIDRGSHTLRAQVLKYGKVIASSDMITVYLHRASLLQRKPPAVTPK